MTPSNLSNTTKAQEKKRQARRAQFDKGLQHEFGPDIFDYFGDILIAKAEARKAEAAEAAEAARIAAPDPLFAQALLRSERIALALPRPPPRAPVGATPAPVRCTFNAGKAEAAPKVNTQEPLHAQVGPSARPLARPARAFRWPPKLRTVGVTRAPAPATADEPPPAPATAEADEAPPVAETQASASAAAEPSPLRAPAPATTDADEPPQAPATADADEPPPVAATEAPAPSTTDAGETEAQCTNPPPQPDQAADTMPAVIKDKDSFKPQDAHYSRLKSVNDDLYAKLEDRDAQIASLQLQLDSAQQEVKDLNKLAEDTKKSYDEAWKSIDGHLADLRVERQSHEKTKKELADYKKQYNDEWISSVESELKEERESHAAVRSERDDKTSDLSAAQRYIDKVEEQLKAQEEELRGSDAQKALEFMTAINEQLEPIFAEEGKALTPATFAEHIARLSQQAALNGQGSSSSSLVSQNEQPQGRPRLSGDNRKASLRDELGDKDFESEDDGIMHADVHADAGAHADTTLRIKKTRRSLSTTNLEQQLLESRGKVHQLEEQIHAMKEFEKKLSAQVEAETELLEAEKRLLEAEKQADKKNIQELRAQMSAHEKSMKQLVKSRALPPQPERERIVHVLHVRNATVWEALRNAPIRLKLLWMLLSFILFVFMSRWWAEGMLWLQFGASTPHTNRLYEASKWGEGGGLVRLIEALVDYDSTLHG